MTSFSPPDRHSLLSWLVDSNVNCKKSLDFHFQVWEPLSNVRLSTCFPLHRGASSTLAVKWRSCACFSHVGVKVGPDLNQFEHESLAFNDMQSEYSRLTLCKFTIFPPVTPCVLRSRRSRRVVLISIWVFGFIWSNWYLHGTSETNWKSFTWIIDLLYINKTCHIIVHV